MRYSHLFGKTTKAPPADATLTSHKLLIQAGYIRESSAGRYFFLPLGQIVQQKIIQIVKKHMDIAGGQEMSVPLLHPLALWEETNRDKSAGYELMKVADRHGSEFALGGTAEEMFVDIVRKFQVSYKDLPFNIYQFSSKFRDELRARGGLLRVREFIMKDAYSFHSDENDFKKEYAIMKATYQNIFKELDLESIIVEADNGYIGGDYSHEFQVLCDAGEDVILRVASQNRYFNREIAPSSAPHFAQDGEKIQPMEEVLGTGIIGVQELAKYLKIPVEKTTKTLIFQTDRDEIVAAAVRGDYDVSEAKLKRVLGCTHLQLADATTVKKVTGAEVGYAGILNLPKNVRVIMDDSTANRINFECGANRTNYHSINVNFERDIPTPASFFDIKKAKEGDVYPETSETYEIYRGIEVSNVFQLGYHYTSRMKNATFISEDGKEHEYYMGCYGLGIGRSMAAVVETHHDERGIIWPASIAPYQVHLIGLDMQDKEINKQAEGVYQQLQKKGIDVLFDDRESTMAGAKFADCDLIGIPYRLVVSKRTEGKIELKKRSEKTTNTFDIEKILEIVSSI